MGGTLVKCLRNNHFLRWRVLFKSEDFGRSRGSYSSHTNNFFGLIRMLMSQNVNNGISIMSPIRTNQNALSGTRHKILSG